MEKTLAIWKLTFFHAVCLGQDIAMVPRCEARRFAKAKPPKRISNPHGPVHSQVKIWPQ